MILSDSEWSLIEQVVVEAQISLLKNSGRARSKGFEPRLIAELIVKAVEKNCSLNAVTDPLGHYPGDATRLKYYNWFSECGTLGKMFSLLDQTRPGIHGKFIAYNLKRKKFQEKHAKKTLEFVSSNLSWGK